jgi:hypothetical protein
MKLEDRLDAIERAGRDQVYIVILAKSEGCKAERNLEGAQGR